MLLRLSCLGQTRHEDENAASDLNLNINIECKLKFWYPFSKLVAFQILEESIFCTGKAAEMMKRECRDGKICKTADMHSQCNPWGSPDSSTVYSMAKKPPDSLSTSVRKKTDWFLFRSDWRLGSSDSYVWLSASTKKCAEGRALVLHDWFGLFNWLQFSRHSIIRQFF